MSTNLETKDSKMVKDNFEKKDQTTNEVVIAASGNMWAQLASNPESPASPSVESLELVDDSDTEDAPANENRMPGRGQANLSLRATMAKRMIAARELNGYSQTEAALLIGWKTPTQLSLIEQGKRIPPHHVLLLISRVYGVSTDYLYALDDEPERDSRAAAKKAQVRQIADMLNRNAEAVTEALSEAYRYDAATEIRGSGIVSKVSAVCDAIARFRVINTGMFDSSRGSAALLYAADQVSEASIKVSNLLDQSERRTEFALLKGRLAMSATENRPKIGAGA